MKLKNIAVIGSNGFLGSHLVKRLQAEPGVCLSLFGRNSASTFGDAIPYHVLNVADTAQLKKQFAGIDLVYYLASETIPSSSWATPMLDIEKNLVPFIGFMEGIAGLGIQKVVFLSSGGTIYGPTSTRANEDAPKDPFSPHGIIKLTMEYFLNYFERKNRTKFDVYRVSNVYGEGQDTKKGIGIINTFLENIIKESKVRIFGNGENVRNYLYVKDLAELLTLSLRNDADCSGTFNVASNDSLSINELVQIIRAATGQDFEVLHTETRLSDNPVILLDNTKILAAFPGFAFTAISEGIRTTYRSMIP